MRILWTKIHQKVLRANKRGSFGTLMAMDRHIFFMDQDLDFFKKNPSCRALSSINLLMLRNDIAEHKTQFYENELI